ncbi:hypothetical protein BVY04_01950 [bacterium M21]|nr:hypothetical protein BVY04_01950 [bacterium M21]
MLVNFNNGTGSRAWDSTKEIRGKNPVPADFLTLCLDSYFATKWTDCPFVVVDDGSTDDSVELLERYSNRFTHFIKNGSNVGLTPSIDMAAELLLREGCDAICRFDGDIEFITPGWDQKILQHFLHNRRTGSVGAVQIAPFGGVLCHGDMMIHPKGYSHILGPADLRMENCKLFFTGDTAFGDIECDSVMGCLAAFRSTAFKRVNGMRKDFYGIRGQTEDINLRILLEGYQCVSLGSVVFIHRHCEYKKKVSRQDTTDKLQESLVLWKRLWGFDKGNIDLQAVYERWQGTPLTRNLLLNPDGQVQYVGP